MSHKHLPSFLLFLKILNVGAHFRNKIHIFLLIVLPTCQLSTVEYTQHYQLSNLSFQCRTKLPKKKKSLFELIILSKNFFIQISTPSVQLTVQLTRDEKTM